RCDGSGPPSARAGPQRGGTEIESGVTQLSTRRQEGPEPGTADNRERLVRLAFFVAVLLVLAVVSGFFPFAVVIFAVMAIVMVHELGHFVTAKWAGMKVTEYFFGFGPRLWSVRKGETEYGVKAIPAGGYVRIIGMSNVDVVDPEDEDRTYRAKPYRHRLGVAVAGSTMHFLIAGGLLFAVFAFVGLPDVRPVVEQIVPDSPAQHSDFRVGDRIVAVNGITVHQWEDIPT